MFLSTKKNPPVCLFQTVCLLFLAYFPTRTLIPDRTFISDSRVNLLVNHASGIIISVLFRMYDLDGNGKICQGEVKSLLLLLIGDDQQVCKKDLIKISSYVIDECSKEDRLISFDEFCDAMEKIDIKHKMSIHF